MKQQCSKILLQVQWSCPSLLPLVLSQNKNSQDVLIWQFSINLFYLLEYPLVQSSMRGENHPSLPAVGMTTTSRITFRIFSQRIKKKRLKTHTPVTMSEVKIFKNRLHNKFFYSKWGLKHKNRCGKRYSFTVEGNGLLTL